MKGDFTRFTFDPTQHHRRVLLQQGRVQLDADHNEQVAIGVHRDQAMARDVIGRVGGPRGNAAFQVLTDPADLPDGVDTDSEPGDFWLGPGRYYVDGVMCESEAWTRFSAQPDLSPGPLPGTGGYLLYLDVWERHITALEDPSLREVALGGPDTATRTRTVWQARARRTGAQAPGECPDDATVAALDPGTSARLRARAVPEDPPAGPCALPESAGYRGMESQLYRVEVHRGGPASEARFKWSRDNGSVAFAVLGVDDPAAAEPRLTLAYPRRDAHLELETGDWVELACDASVRDGMATTLLKVGSVQDAGGDRVEVQLSGALPGAFVADADQHPILRRWDHGEGDEDVDGDGIVIEEGAGDEGWVTLEKGVQVQLRSPDEGGASIYRNGDYWVIPARTLTGDVEWPRDDTGQPSLRPPHGVDHHLAALAILQCNGGGNAPLTVELIRDCRPLFPPLTDLPTADPQEPPPPVQTAASCCVAVGPGGEFERLDEALAALLEEQRRRDICLLLLPGEHVFDGWDHERMAGDHVRLTGCGPTSRLVARRPMVVDGMASFTLQNLRGDFESVEFDERFPGAIVARGLERLVVEGCDLAGLSQRGEVGPVGSLLHIQGVARVRVVDNVFEAAMRESLEFHRRTMFGDGEHLELMQELLENLDRRHFERAVEDAAQKLAEMGPNQPELGAIRNRIQGYCREYFARLSLGELTAYAKLGLYLGSSRRSADTLEDYLCGLRRAAVTHLPGVAIVLDRERQPSTRLPTSALGTIGDFPLDVDLDDHTRIQANEIVGIVSLGGSPGKPAFPDDATRRDLARHLGGAVSLVEHTGILRLEGNQIALLALSAELYGQVARRVGHGEQRPLHGVFGHAQIHDNVFAGALNQVLATRVALCNNLFSLTAHPLHALPGGQHWPGDVLTQTLSEDVEQAVPAGVSFAESSLVLGNHTGRRRSAVLYDVRRGGERVGNVGIGVSS